MKIKSLFIFLTLSFLFFGCRSPKPPPVPTTWRSWLKDDALGVWKSFTETGKFDTDLFFEKIYEKGVDGDEIIFLALYLVEVKQDPYPSIKKWINSENPDKRAWAAIIAGTLGDKRFFEDIKKLSQDKTIIKDQPTMPSVAERAAFAIRLAKENRVSDLLLVVKIPDWLKKARGEETGN